MLVKVECAHKDCPTPNFCIEKVIQQPTNYILRSVRQSVEVKELDDALERIDNSVVSIDLSNEYIIDYCLSGHKNKYFLKELNTLCDGQ